MNAIGQTGSLTQNLRSATWHVGRFTIVSVPEIDASEVIQSIIPEAIKSEIQLIPWLRPNFVDEVGSLRAVVQSFLIEADGKKILVDTCVGNSKNRTDTIGWNQLDTNYIERLSQLDFLPERVDYVLCTHLHFDHVGWNTCLEDGRWVPTFKNAKYIFSKREYEYWKSVPSKEIADDHAGFVDSVLPIIDAGLAVFVDETAEVLPGISLIPTPGHTPSHVSVLIESEGSRAIISGDMVHHPCQIARPDWSTLADGDSDKARTTRRSIFEKYGDNVTLLIGSHFSYPAAGRLGKDRGAFRLYIDSAEGQD